MKTMKAGWMAAWFVVVVMVALSVFNAWGAPYEELDLNKVTIRGVEMTANAADLNKVTDGGMAPGKLSVAAGSVIVGNASAAGAATALSGNVAVSSAGLVTVPTNTPGVTVTNNGTITLSAGLNVVKPISGANAATNSVTLANVSAPGLVFYLACESTATNSMNIGASGPWKSSAQLVEAGDMIIIVSSATNALYGAQLP